jgi:hypothetical protein
VSQPNCPTRKKRNEEVRAGSIKCNQRRKTDDARELRRSV